MDFGKGSLRDCDFYISDREDRSGMAFCMAYRTAILSKDNKELCSSVGSMICALAIGLRIPVDLALNGIGVRPCEVMLPSEAQKYDIKVGEFPKMDWPSILVNFGCCILVLLKNNYENEASYKAYMSNCIHEMQGKVGYDPGIADLDVPFDFERAKAIRTMLGGVTSTLRDSVVKHMMENINSGNENFQICSLYNFLFHILYWSGWDELDVMNEMLVKPQSPVLSDPCVSLEVENLTHACEVVKSRDLDPQTCIHTRNLIHMASNAELLSVVDCLKFPTLFAVAQELRKGGNGSSVAESAVISMAGVKLTTVKALVQLHRNRPQPTAMPFKTVAQL